MSTCIVLGLGNPGASYRATRHNLGFRVVGELSSRFEARAVRLPAEAPLLDLARAVVGGRETLLARPSTFMNRAGLAAAWLTGALGVPPARLVVVFDDADLALGRVRVRRGGGSGGHRGIRSISECLETGDFPRVKLGVRGTGRAGVDLAEYVLARFDAGELEQADELVRLGADVVEAILADGVDAAMSRYNAAPDAGDPGEREDESERALE